MGKNHQKQQKNRKGERETEQYTKSIKMMMMMMMMKVINIHERNLNILFLVVSVQLLHQQTIIKNDQERKVLRNSMDHHQREKQGLIVCYINMP